MSQFSADHQGFYLKDAPFFPLVQEGTHVDVSQREEGANTLLIRLPAHLSDDLDWSAQRRLAEEAVLKGKYLLWEIALGLKSFTFTPEDTASFYAFSLALEEFTKTVWPQFQEQTFGVAIYRGTLPSEERFPRSHWETSFIERGGEDYSLYCAQNFAEYLHRLVSFLPDAALPFALIDVSEIPSAARVAQLLSKERFEYVHLALQGARVPFAGLCWEEGEMAQGASSAALGVLLPKDEHFCPNLLEGMDTLFSHLKEKGSLFRIVCEEKLTEQWDGLDELIVFPSAVSPQGKRKLQGFLAAGGTLLSAEELLDTAIIC